MTNKFNFIQGAIEQRKTESRFRTLKTIDPLEGKHISWNNEAFLDFSSNDYLGLAAHPAIQKKAIEYIQKLGNGSTASRLITGSYSAFQDIENKIASLKGTEAALILNSGYQANVTIIPALANRHSVILSDRLNHNSLIQGARLSQATIKRFHHNDMEHLETLLKKSQNFGRILVVTESVFSMDGDQSDIDYLVDLTTQYNAILMVDEAHATGVFGKQGMGLTAHKSVDLTLGTFGKALGSFGAYVGCSEQMKSYLINCCHGFIYSTALPPAVLGSIDAALDLIVQYEEERKTFLAKADFLREALQTMGFDTGASSTHIIPILLGSESKTLQMADYLLDKKIFAIAIRPPTVEKGKSRIRLSLSAVHTWEDIHYLIKVLQKSPSVLS